MTLVRAVILPLALLLAAPVPCLRLVGDAVALGRRGSIDLRATAAALPDDDRLLAIAEAGGIPPLIAMLSAADAVAGKEQAACALWHLVAAHHECH